VIASIKTKKEGVKPANVGAGLTLLFCSFLFFYDLSKERFLLTERDLGGYFIPPRFFWVESIKHGDFPLWNPYQFSGHPFLANPQYGILYPINSLFFILPFDFAFNTIIVLHFFLGGLFTYIFLRDLKVSVTGALLSGVTFMLGGFLLSVHGLLTCLLTVIWTPLIMMLFKRALDQPCLKNEALAAIFITVSFLGGGVEIVYCNFFVLLFMVFFSPQLNPPLLNGEETGLWRVVRRVRTLVVVCVFFLLLSAIQLFPFVELYTHSIRGTGLSFFEATTWSFAPKDILLFFLPDAYGYWLDLKKYWVTQCWFKTLYTGGLPFILSLIYFFSPRRMFVPKPECLATPLCHCERPKGACLHAVVRFGTQAWQSVMRLLRSFPSLAMTLGYRPERREGSERGFGKERWFFLSLMIFSIFLSLGRYNPLYSFVFKYVPFFGGIRYPAKFLYLFVLVLSITTGLGFERLTEYSKENRKRTLKRLLIVVSLISALVLLFLILGHQEIAEFLKSKGIDFPDFNYVSLNLYHAKRFFFYLTLFLLLLSVGHEVKWKAWAKVLVILFLVADLFGNMGFYGRELTSTYFKKTRILEIISSDKANGRVFSTAKTISLEVPLLIGDASFSEILKEKHLPCMNLLHGLHDIWGNDVVRIKRAEDLYKALTSAPSISATNLLDLYGVRYVISVTPIEGDPRFELIYSRIEGLQGEKEELLKGNTIKLYRNRDPLPRAWLATDHRVLDEKSILAMLSGKEFNPRKEVLLEETPGGATPNSLFRRQAPNRAGTGQAGEPRTPNSISGLPEFVSENNNRIDLHVTTKEDAFLVLSDTYFPGWKAYVDGNPVKIFRANYNFRAVSIPPGKHDVKFVYRPTSVRLGVLVTSLGIIGIAVVGFSSRFKVTKRRGVPLRTP
jgi:hypothetical protein